MNTSDPATSGTPLKSGSVAKEQLTAYQRWELVAFDKAEEKPVLTNAPSVNPAELIAAELTALRQQARDEGYAAGMQAGYATGQQQVLTDTAHLQTLMQNLQLAINQIDEQLAQSLLNLSLEIARKMLLEVLHVKNDIILQIVSAAIGNLPHFNQNAHLIMHPLDAELVREKLGEQLTQGGWKIFSDEQIERGGCRVETAHSNIDATNSTRWQHIVQSIGQDHSWIS